MSTDVFVARQPIFDQSMGLYGYELLHRSSQNNFYEGGDDEQTTAELITNSFLVIGFNELIDGTRGFINFSHNFLLKGIPSILPKEKTVIEILERANVTDDLINVCRDLKSKGYILALDDFVLEGENDSRERLIEYADIIKIEFPNVPIYKQAALISKYKNKIMFLAERVETREEFHKAVEMGYRLFQGYFFSKPIMVNAKDIGTIDINAHRILEELQKEDPDYRIISSIIEKDLNLSYKLLKISNSVYYNAKRQINTIFQALVLLGTQEIFGWISLMLFRKVQTPENAEIVKSSMINGKLISLLANETNQGSSFASDCFMVGILSSMDVILNQNMAQIVADLPLTPQVSATLLGSDTKIRHYLDAVLAFEKGQWDITYKEMADNQITQERFMELYLDALKWKQSLYF